MKKILLMFVLCVGLTDPQYKNEVVRIIATNLTSADSESFTAGYAYIMVRKMVRYRNAGGGAGSTEDVAGRCFVKDLYKDITGTDVDAHQANHVKGLIEEMFPGQGFAP